MEQEGPGDAASALSVVHCNDTTDSPPPPNRISDPAPTATRTHTSGKDQIPPTLPRAPLPQRDNLSQHNGREGAEATGYARDGTGDDELVHGLGETAEQTAEAEGEVGDEEERFEPEDVREGAVEELDRGHGEEVAKR